MSTRITGRHPGPDDRDLTFHPLGGMIGSPTLLVTGLELRG